MVEALASSNSKAFWQQVYHVNKSEKSSPVFVVADVSGSPNISQLFSAKFEALLIPLIPVSVMCSVIAFHLVTLINFLCLWSVLRHCKIFGGISTCF